MNKLLIVSVFMILGNILILSAQIPPHPKSYYCRFTDEKIVIDGKASELAWTNAKWTDSFVDISGSTSLKPSYNTKVKMLWNSEYLYISAILDEEHIWAKIKENEKVIFYDNDFEVFIDPDGDNHNYMEFEYNAFGTWWDLYLGMPYRDGGLPLTCWTCNGKSSAVTYMGTINNPTGIADSTWTIEIAIPFSCLGEAIGEKYKYPEFNEKWRINFSRVQWDTEIVDGEYIKKDMPENNWVWSPQWSINMHKPEYWGYLIFVDSEPYAENELYVDEYWEIKQYLMQIYYAENKYYKNYQKYSADIESLIKSTGISSLSYEIDVTHKQFTAFVEINDIIWYVNQKGRLWSEKK